MFVMARTCSGAVPGYVVRVSEVCTGLATPGIDCNFDGGKHLEGWLDWCPLLVSPLHMTAAWPQVTDETDDMC